MDGQLRVGKGRKPVRQSLQLFVRASVFPFRWILRWRHRKAKILRHLLHGLVAAITATWCQSRSGEANPTTGLIFAVSTRIAHLSTSSFDSSAKPPAPQGLRVWPDACRSRFQVVFNTPDVFAYAATLMVSNAPTAWRLDYASPAQGEDAWASTTFAFYRPRASPNAFTRSATFITCFGSDRRLPSSRMGINLSNSGPECEPVNRMRTG